MTVAQKARAIITHRREDTGWVVCSVSIDSRIDARRAKLREDIDEAVPDHGAFARTLSSGPRRYLYCPILHRSEGIQSAIGVALKTEPRLPFQRTWAASPCPHPMPSRRAATFPPRSFPRGNLSLQCRANTAR